MILRQQMNCEHLHSHLGRVFKRYSIYIEGLHNYYLNRTDRFNGATSIKRLVKCIWFYKCHCLRKKTTQQSWLICSFNNLRFHLII